MKAAIQSHLKGRALTTNILIEEIKTRLEQNGLKLKGLDADLAESEIIVSTNEGKFKVVFRNYNPMTHQFVFV